jgi:hypothetical protein
MSVRSSPRFPLLLLALLVAAPVAGADYISGFETLNGAPDGIILTGQDGYYLPVSESVDFLVYTYAGNTLGLPANPEGGDQFIAGTGPGGTTYCRAQRDVSFDETVHWKLTYDFAAAYLGQPPSANNLGSFSIRSSDTAVNYIHLMSWVDPNDPTLYNAFYLAYDASGTQFLQPGESPGFSWESLELNHWYRAWTVIDLDLNMILEVGIMDLTTGIPEVYAPTDWYLEGGAAGGSGPPTSIRFFAGGSVEGNVLAFDNIDVRNATPVPVNETTWGAVKALYR